MNKRAGRGAFLSVLVAAGFAAVGCGSSSEDAAKEKQACQAATSEFVTAVQDLDARLNVGVAYAEYGTKVGDISAAHARIDPTAEIFQNEDCLNIVTAGETAFNSYVQANQIWTQCIRSTGYNPSCARAEMLRRLRAQWSDASSQIEQLTAALMSFGQPGASANTNCPSGQTVNENGYCG